VTSSNRRSPPPARQPSVGDITTVPRGSVPSATGSAPAPSRATASAPAGRKRRKVDPLVGQVVDGRFKVLQLVARGGMGKVYRAEQQPLGRVCALKVLNPKHHGADDPEFQQRFFLEAATASKLSHPNTITIFDYGCDGELYFIAMEHLAGRTLYRMLREDGRFDRARTLRIIRQVARSLRSAHRASVIHRDVKPANIMVLAHADEPDTVKVLDFGLVKLINEERKDLTRQGTFLGSPKYMAPEQILGHDVTPAADVYSLAIVAYEMLCGKVPFDKGASVKTLMAQVHDEAPTMYERVPGVPVDARLHDVIMRCLRKEPSERYADMDAFLAALASVDGAPANPSLAPPPVSLASTPAISLANSPPPPPPSRDGDGELPDIDIPAALPIPDLLEAPRPSRAEEDDSFEMPTLDAYQEETTEQIADEPPPPAGRVLSPLLLVAGALALMALGAALVVIGFGGTLRGGDTPQGGEHAPQSTVSASTPSASAQLPAMRVVQVRSEPTGARVERDGAELCPATPCRVRVSNDGAPAQLTISKPGFEPTAVLVGDGPVLQVKLEPEVPLFEAPPEGEAPAQRE
jgi:serine/threonine-protein kinase